jgi:hypothetical protein
MTTKPEDRLLPASAIAAMLLAASVIVGLAYWVGDSIAPELAAFVQVTNSEAVAAPAPALPISTRNLDAAAGR